MKTKKQFILDTLLPYKQDVNLCAYYHGDCMYLLNDGRKCAVGKHMREGEWQHYGEGFLGLIKLYKEEDFFTEEAFKMALNTEAWDAMQEYHDTLLVKKDRNLRINLTVDRLERATNLKFNELRFEFY